jgi:hypothetical protein
MVEVVQIVVLKPSCLQDDAMLQVQIRHQELERYGCCHGREERNLEVAEREGVATQKAECRKQRGRPRTGNGRPLLCDFFLWRLGPFEKAFRKITRPLSDAVAGKLEPSDRSNETRQCRRLLLTVAGGSRRSSQFKSNLDKSRWTAAITTKRGKTSN